ncbi:MAG TPA: hypothetical protein VHG92_02820 [Afifellaceae bacterium]|nr:hypothetical protein [Afifellaceae bacterium]
MARARKQGKPKRRRLALQPGDTVLLGGTRASYPWHWHYGRVVWADERDALIERGSWHGESWREVVSIHEVRAVGDIAELGRVKQLASEAVRELQKRVDEATSELGRARDALFAKLDELAEAEPAIFPPDFAAIDEAHAATRRAIEACEEAEASAP